uniref:MAM domain-containing protein n=1 Tax=Rhabditophanes sp. KR3021 TaxID=114890 RepID=A0AC35TRH4_9BILA
MMASAGKTMTLAPLGNTAFVRDGEVMTPINSRSKAFAPSIKKISKCMRPDFGFYTPKELIDLATLYTFHKPNTIIPTILNNGQTTCSFDFEPEKCAWYSEKTNQNKFYKARFETLFDLNKFDCTSEREFNFDDYFLLGYSDQAVTSNDLNLNLDVPCQSGPGLLSFDYWSNNESATLQVCILIAETSTEQCGSTTLAKNPLTFEIAETLKPFTIKLHVKLGGNNLILMDNIKYTGKMCDVLNNQIEEIGNTFAGQDTNKFVEEDTNKLVAMSEGSPNRVASIKTLTEYEVREDNSIDSNSPLIEMLSGDKKGLDERNEICRLLVCDFNSNSTCHWRGLGELATRSWKISSIPVGNPLTGIQRKDRNDPSLLGNGFAYAGTHISSQNNDVYIMESPSFSSTIDFNLVFDIYSRSYGVDFLVCLDSFQDCPFKSRPVEKDTYWLVDQKVLVKKETKKIFLVIDLIEANQYIGLDNIRLFEGGKDSTNLCN